MSDNLDGNLDGRKEQNTLDKDTHIAPIPRISIQCFCETSEAANLVQTAASDRRMSKAQIKINMGGAAAAVEAYRSAPTPNLIILENSGGRDSLLQSLDELSEYCDVTTKVLILGKVNDIVLFRNLIMRGVSDYLVMPVKVLDILHAISQLYVTSVSNALGRVIAVAGSKGGVGASTIAHNIAWSISHGLELSTVVVDLDLGFGTGALDFNQDPSQTIAEAVIAPDRVDSNFIDRLLAKCSENLNLLAAPATLETCYDLSENAFEPIIDILRGTTPFIILDVPHYWTSWAKKVMLTADETIIVSQPDLANLRNAKNLVDTLKNLRKNDDLPKLILNGVNMPRRPEITISDFSKTIQIEPIAIINHDVKLFGTAANNGQMIAELEGADAVAEKFSQIAKVLTKRSEMHKTSTKKNFLAPLLAKIKLSRSA